MNDLEVLALLRDGIDGFRRALDALCERESDAPPQVFVEGAGETITVLIKYKGNVIRLTQREARGLREYLERIA